MHQVELTIVACVYGKKSQSLHQKNEKKVENVKSTQSRFDVWHEIEKLKTLPIFFFFFFFISYEKSNEVINENNETRWNTSGSETKACES